MDLEIVIERSKTNDKGVTISMWKNLKGKFRVESYDGKHSAGIHDFKLGEALARRKYEDCCDKNPSCSPYPEAEAYYKRKGLL